MHNVTTSAVLGTDKIHLDQLVRLPQEMRQLPQWALASSGPDKKPLTVDGRNADPTDPDTWTDFETAYRVALERGWHIGFMLHHSDEFACIDLDVKDASTHPEKPHLWTTAEDIQLYQRIVEQLDTYTERSRSGRGLHLWVRANIGRGCKRGGVEVYSQQRFIICTGDIWQDKPVADRQDMLANMVSQMRPLDSGDDAALVELEREEDDWHVLKRAVEASNTEKFCALWSGEWDRLGYSSQSEADLALLSILAFYSPSNQQCRDLFRESGLGKREKAQKDDRYLNRSLGKIRDRQWAEQRRTDAIKAQMPTLQASIDAALAERRERQRFRFKQIGEGDIDVTSTRPPTMDLDMMHESLVHVAAEKPLVVFRDMPAVRVPPTVMASLLAHNRMKIIDKKGKEEKVPIFGLWLASDRRFVVYTLTFDPRAGEFCHSPDQRPALNLWKPRPHNPPQDWEARVHPFLEHVGYLVPDDAERQRFLDWLAHVEQKPGELPHAHYLMIATSQGVGRNWLSNLLACVWAGHVALDYDLKASLNSGFNGQLSRKLLAVVDEINEGGTGERWQHSEKLKSMVTTSERFINAKYGLQHSEVNCCRWLLFSNYESALPLHSDDRRWNVIRNPSEPKDADYYLQLYRTLADTKFIASVRELLRTRDISQFNPGARAVMNEAKEAVVATSMTQEDEKAAELVESCPRDLILSEHLFEVIYDIDPSMAGDASRRWKLLAPIAR
jgi:primase-polymerase (primpol)-like protein